MNRHFFVVEIGLFICLLSRYDKAGLRSLLYPKLTFGRASACLILKNKQISILVNLNQYSSMKINVVEDSLEGVEAIQHSLMEVEVVEDSGTAFVKSVTKGEGRKAIEKRSNPDLLFPTRKHPP
ncbi:hypothetical protein RIF29_23849 [Crotalaria pallida]|uniref:Uncharacterized protein n=1 Tax=Crotalaria pallida TaxID=3830 RepID=A0AAN9HW08_CROPI